MMSGKGINMNVVFSSDIQRLLSSLQVSVRLGLGCGAAEMERSLYYKIIDPRTDPSQQWQVIRQKVSTQEI